MVEGYCDEDFLAVKELFLSNFLTGEDENAQLCVYIGSEKIIDLYGCQNPSNIARYDNQSLQVTTEISFGMFFLCTYNYVSYILTSGGLQYWQISSCRCYWPFG